MTVNRTTLLDLPIITTGTESGAWGNITNNGLTEYMDIAIAGTQVLSTDADVTLTSTDGDSSATNIGATTAQYAILRWTASGSTTRNITVPAKSKTYVVINATGGTQSIVLRGAGPTTGVTIIAGEKAHCVWNGSDFVKISSSAAAGGSNTQVQYNNAGVLAGSANLTFDGTNFATTGTASATKFIPTGGTATGNGMYLPTSNELAWSNNGSETMRLTSTGLGIGTSSPGAKLHVLGADGAITSITAGATGKLRAFGYVDSTRAALLDSINTAENAYLPLTLNGSSLLFQTGATTKATLDSSGNLGLGVTPSAWNSGAKALQISSTSSFYGSSNATLIGQNTFNNTSGNNIYLTTAAASLYQQFGGAHSWYTAPSGTAGNTISFTQAMTLTSGGNLLVGSTSNFGANVRTYLVATTGGNALITQTDTASAFVEAVWNQGTSGDNKFTEFGTEATYTGRGSIDYNRAGGLVRYNTTSDYRAKDIIGPVQNPGAIIDALKVYEGKMKGATQSRPMLIAHEAQAHAPYAVSGVKDEVNEDGTPKFQQMDVSSLVPLLLAEIQSLRQRVALLEGN